MTCRAQDREPGTTWSLERSAHAAADGAGDGAMPMAAQFSGFEAREFGFGSAWLEDQVASTLRDRGAERTTICRWRDRRCWENSTI